MICHCKYSAKIQISIIPSHCYQPFHISWIKKSRTHWRPNPIYFVTPGVTVIWSRKNFHLDHINGSTAIWGYLWSSVNGSILDLVLLGTLGRNLLYHWVYWCYMYCCTSSYQGSTRLLFSIRPVQCMPWRGQNQPPNTVNSLMFAGINVCAFETSHVRGD